MKQLFIVYFQILYCLPCIGQSAKQINGADFIVKNVNVIPMNSPDKILRNQTVIIDDGKIAFLGKSKLFDGIKNNANVISGRGKYLIPGMVDMHCHFPDTSQIKSYYILNLMAGITTLRSMAGQSGPVDVYKNVNFPSPNVYLSGIVTSKTHLTVNNTDSLVEVYKDSGLDFIKIFSIRDTSSFVALMKSAKERKMPVCGHYLKNVGIAKLIGSGYGSIEHFGGQDEVYNTGDEYLERIITYTKTNGTTHCPTLDWYRLTFASHDLKQLKSREGMKLIPDSTSNSWELAINEQIFKMGKSKVDKQVQWYRNLWEIHKNMLRKYHEAGVNIVIGLDAGSNFSVPGFAMIEEMRLYKEAGLTNYQILQCATVNAAKYFSEQERWGTIEVGKEGNMVLLESNPLEDLNAISTPGGVFIKSAFYESRKLREYLDRQKYIQRSK